MLKGTTTFELQNVKTGEVERYVDENMFTNALNEIYNKAPFGMGNGLLNGEYLQDVNRHYSPFNRVFETALGGILLFPQPLEENANSIFAPASNKPVGIASIEANPASDPRRGSYNAIESGAITNGFRYVYDFTTSQANGTISAISLTSKWGGAKYLDDLSYLICGSTKALSTTAIGYGRLKSIVDSTDAQAGLIGADSSGMYFLRSDNKTVQKFSVKPYALSLLANYSRSEVLGVIDTAGYTFITSSHICVMRTSGNSSGNASITIDRYSKTDFSKTSVSYSIPATLAATKAGHIISYDEENDYLYCLGRVESKYYKVKLSNTADTSEINVSSSGSQLFNCSPFFIGNNFLIERDNTVHASSTEMRYPFVSRLGCYVLGRPESIGSASAYARCTSFNVFAPYLATVNNLDRTVSKTPDKTMKVTYTVTYS